MSHASLDNPEYYEHHWRSERLQMSAALQEKIQILELLIPEEVQTILDVGCGNGLITNALAKHWAITGLDRAKAALSSLKGPSICASADQIPAPDRAFDMVLSSELLEHLPEPVLAGAAKEMQRVADRYMLIAVPNREYLRKRFACCSECGLEFHAYLHQHSFTPETLDALFPDFTRLTTRTCGVLEVPTHPAFDRMRQRWGRHWFVPFADMTCPACTHPVKPMTRSLGRRLVGRVADVMNLAYRLVTPTDPFWLIALYARKAES